MHKTIILSAAFILLHLLHPVVAQQSPVEEVNSEVIKRQEDLIRGDGFISDGFRFLNGNEYDKAIERFESALKLIGNASPATEKSIINARNGLSTAYYQKAVALAEQGNQTDSAEAVRRSLEYNPKNSQSLRLKEKEESKARELAAKEKEKEEALNEVNPALTKEFLADQDEIGKLFKAGEAYYQTGQYDEAIKAYQNILVLDKDNLAAARKLKQVYDRKLKSANAMKDELDARAAWEVRDKWTQDFVRDTRQVTDEEAESRRSIPDDSPIDKKLARIKLDKIRFTDADLQSVVSFFQARSRDLDPEKKGINIVNQLPPEYPTRPVTLEMNDITFRDALKFALRNAGADFKIEEPVAVIIVPLGEAETLQTRKYRLPAGFIPVDIRPGGVQATGAGARVGTGAATEETPLKTALEEKGITFPTGASATLVGSNTLIMKNTNANLDLLDELVRETAQFQVKIEARFVDLKQDNLSELGFDWIVGPYQFLSRADGQQEMVANGASSADGVNNLVTGGLRNSSGSSTSGRQALSVSSLDALLAGGAATPASPNAIAALTGVLTRPQFQIVIRALSQKKNVDLLSAPSVTVKPDEEAKIQVTREFIYPTEFEPPQVPQSTSTVVGGTAAAVVTPANPSNFVMRETGVVLTARPQVDTSRLIQLTLLPEVVEFEGFVNYGSPIQSVNPAGGDPVVLTENAINQPIFSVRRVSTRVYVYDGETVAIGGLIREDIQKVDDKVPILGDIPGLGRLFQNKLEQSTKRNLIIFVTASLVDPSGELLSR